MQTIELAVLDWIQLRLRCGFLDWLLPLVSGLCNHGEIWMVLAAALLAVRERRRQGLAVAMGLGVDAVAFNLILKPLIGRSRPFMVNTAVVLLTHPPGDASFPSGHTAASFAAAFALRQSGSRLWKPAMALAVVIALSRLYLYVHWPTDVLAGAVLGAAAGWAGAKLVESVCSQREA